MSQVLNFESRIGRPQATPEEVYAFMTDLRNFRQFVPKNTINTLVIDKETCSFVITAIGSVDIKLSGKNPFSRVEYAGNALQDNEFSLILNINRSDSGSSEVKIFLDAELNPFLRMMATGPIRNFLETLIDEMEKFKGWKETNQ